MDEDELVAGWPMLLPVARVARVQAYLFRPPTAELRDLFAHWSSFEDPGGLGCDAQSLFDLLQRVSVEPPIHDLRASLLRTEHLPQLHHAYRALRWVRDQLGDPGWKPNPPQTPIGIVQFALVQWGWMLHARLEGLDP